MLNAVIHPMIKFEVDKPRECFRQEIQWTLAIRYQLSTVSALDLDRINHLPYTLLPEKDTYCLPDRNQWIANTLRRIQSVGDRKALQYCPLLIEYNWM